MTEQQKIILNRLKKNFKTYVKLYSKQSVIDSYAKLIQEIYDAGDQLMADKLKKFVNDWVAKNGEEVTNAIIIGSEFKVTKSTKITGIN